jgi:Rha family phage regulatory protein
MLPALLPQQPVVSPDRMSSREIAELTGKQHSNIMRDIRDLGQTLMDSNLNSCIESSTYIGGDGRSYPMYNLDRETTICLLTGYDAASRMRVIQRWQALEAKQAPQSAAEIIVMLAQQNLVNEQRISTLEQGQAEIKAQLTTRDEDYYTIAGYASLNKKQMPMLLAAEMGRKATRLSVAKGLPVSSTHDPRFGKVNTYHVSILSELF